MTGLRTPTLDRLDGVCVVIVNYGSHALIEANLLHLSADNSPLQVVVVDNFSSASERGAIHELCDRLGWVVVESDVNLGFGVGMNIGVERAKALGCRSFLLLNPDVRVSTTVMVELAEQARRTPRTLISPRILRGDGTTWFRGSTIDLASGAVRSVSGEFHSGVDTWVSGACLMVHEQMWDELGGFRDGYFLYWEDVDLSRRCVDQGGALIVRDDLQVTHEVGGTQSGGHAPGARSVKSPVYLYYNCRNRLLYGTEHLSSRSLIGWMVRTPHQSWQIMLRSGRRALMLSPRALIAGVCGSVAGLGLAGRELLRRARQLRAADRASVDRPLAADDRSLASTGRPSVHKPGSTKIETGALRIYGYLRTAHLERFKDMVPAHVVFTRNRYDYDESLLPAEQKLQRLSRVGVVKHLLRTTYRVVEVNEPLTSNRWLDIGAQIVAIRLRSILSRRRTRITAYCIGYSDPALEIVDKRPYIPLSVARVTTWLVLNVLVRSIDRFAFGTAGSLSLYRDKVGAKAVDARSALFEALPAACTCSEVGIDEEAPSRRLIFVGAFQERKGVRQVLAGWDAYRDSDPDATFHVIGKGKLLGEVADWAAQRTEVDLDVDPAREFIHGALRRATALVLLSQPQGAWREQVGLPIVEGLAHGLEIVASDETGLAHWLSDHDHVVIPAAANPAEVSGALARVLASRRGKVEILADLPAIDQRVEADRWMLLDHYPIGPNNSV